MRVRATVGGTLVLHDLPEKSAARLERKFSLPNPQYVRAQRYGRWSGGIPPTIDLGVRMPDGSLHLPRGTVGIVKEQIRKDGILGLDVTDRRSEGKTLLLEGHRLGALGLRPYQDEALYLFLRHLQGTVVLPCGCGKTRLGVAALGRLARSAIVLVHTADLADQWCETLEALLGIRPGRVEGGRFDRDADVVVAIDDSLGNVLDREPGWAERFGLCVVDEAHHTPSRTFQTILGKIPARWRLGLTATPDREDGLIAVMDWAFGPRLLERTTKEMIDRGYLMRATVESVATGFRFAFDGPDDDPRRLAATEQALAEDPDRNRMIVQRVVEDARAGETVLVLVGRRGHATDLADMLVREGVEAVALSSRSGKGKRKSAIRDLKDGRLPVLVATSLADEGLDVQRLSRLHLAAPQKARGATFQRLGRLLRVWPGKAPRLVDYLDPCLPMFVRRAQARRRIYREAGLVMLENPQS